MLKWKLLAALGVLFGFVGVAWGFAQQPSEPGFFELRIYTTLPGQREALAARFGDYTTKIYERHWSCSTSARPVTLCLDQSRGDSLPRGVRA